MENIIRVGSAGAMTDKLQLRDIVAGMSAYTTSNYGYQFGFRRHARALLLAMTCSTRAVEAGKALGQNVVPGPVLLQRLHSMSRAGYETATAKLMKLGVLCVEMEAYALYLNAAAAGKNALALLTISDSLVTGEALPAEDRQNTFTKMMEIALEIA